jgi:hypothetical protein
MRHRHGATSASVASYGTGTNTDTGMEVEIETGNRPNALIQRINEFITGSLTRAQAQAYTFNSTERKKEQGRRGGGRRMHLCQVVTSASRGL